MPHATGLTQAGHVIQINAWTAIASLVRDVPDADRQGRVLALRIQVTDRPCSTRPGPLRPVTS